MFKHFTVEKLYVEFDYKKISDWKLKLIYPEQTVSSMAPEGLGTEFCPFCGSDNIGDDPASWINSLHFPDAPDMFECGDCGERWEE